MQAVNTFMCSCRLSTRLPVLPFGFVSTPSFFALHELDCSRSPTMVNILLVIIAVPWVLSWVTASKVVTHVVISMDRMLDRMYNGRVATINTIASGSLMRWIALARSNIRSNLT